MPHPIPWELLWQPPFQVRFSHRNLASVPKAEYSDLQGFGAFGSVIAFVHLGLSTSGEVTHFRSRVWTYLPADAPNYHNGNTLNLATSTAVVVLAFAGFMYVRWENSKRERGERDKRLNKISKQEIKELGYLHPNFRYQTWHAQDSNWVRFRVIVILIVVVHVGDDCESKIVSILNNPSHLDCDELIRFYNRPWMWFGDSVITAIIPVPKIVEIIAYLEVNVRTRDSRRNFSLRTSHDLFTCSATDHRSSSAYAENFRHWTFLLPFTAILAPSSVPHILLYSTVQS